MSKKRGETKMADVPQNGKLLVCDLTENIEPDYSGFASLGKRAAQDRVNGVIQEFSEALGVSVPTADEINEPPKYSLYREVTLLPTVVACTPQQVESASKLLGGVKLSSLPRARSRTFTAKPCTLCTALRGDDTNFTRVYATRDRVRYCKCTYCNNTWKDSDG